MRDIALRKLPQTIIFLAVLFTLLNITDYALTYYAVSTGIAREANPLLSWVPLWNIGLVKAVLGVWIVYRVHNKPPLLIIVSIVMALVVAWNIYCII